MAGRALAAGGQHHAALVCGAQGVEQGLVVRWAGAAAVAFQQQAAYAAVQQRLHVAALDSGEERQHGEVHRLARCAVVEAGGDGCGAFAFARARQFGAGIEGLRAQLAGAGAMQQLAVEEEVHPRRRALAQYLDGAAEVGPGIAALGACRQHGTGQHHRYRQAE
ncbi:hypothetical protein D9M71_582070 [compost metagenome]